MLPLFGWMLWGCFPDPPTATEDISTRLTMNCILTPDSTDHWIFLSRWYPCSQNPWELSDCERSDANDWSVQDARVVLTSSDSVYVAEELTLDDLAELEIHTNIDYLSCYRFTSDQIIPGAIWHIEATHPELDTVTASTTIPDSATFLSQPPDTVDLSGESLVFSWGPANAAKGYLPSLYLVALNDSAYHYFELGFTGFTLYEGGGASYREREAMESTSISYPVPDLVQQIAFFWKRSYPDMPDVQDCRSIYLILQVDAMTEGLYYTQRWHHQPDPFSSFSAPIAIYSNVENGAGIFGSYTVSSSKNIIVPLETMAEILNGK